MLLSCLSVRISCCCGVCGRCRGTVSTAKMFFQSFKILDLTLSRVSTNSFCLAPIVPHLRNFELKLLRFSQTSCNDVNHHHNAASCSHRSPQCIGYGKQHFSSFPSPFVMTNIQPQTRVFDPKGNETFVTRQSEIQIIFSWLQAYSTLDRS